MKYTTLLMDADDTIYDFPACEFRALEQTLNAFGLCFSRAVYDRFTAINSALWKQFEMNRITRSDLRVRRFGELIKACFPGDERATALADRYVQELGKQAIFLEGAKEALEKLSQVYEIYIITNGLETVQKSRFALSGLKRYVKGVFISDAMGVQKPMKAFFEMALKDVGEQDKRKILVVGDSLTSDMQGGRNAGLDTCLFDPKGKVLFPHSLCDYHIHDLEELLRNEEYA